MIPPGYKRISKRERCPVCHKPDWCLIATDRSSAICPRVWEGSKCKMGDAGYLHILDATAHEMRNPREAVYIPPPEPTIDAEFLAEVFERAIGSHLESLAALSRDLQLSEAALQSFRIGWSADHNAWSFPMVDEDGKTIGIRLRRPNGFKFCVTGSRTGLFVPVTFDWSPVMFITEGPTDASAMIDLGFDSVIGRPDCRSNVDRIVNFIQKSPRNTNIVIVADTDKYGAEGARVLASRLAMYRPAKIIYPLDGKDARQWKQYGATDKAVMSVVRNAPFVAKEAA